MDLPGMVLVRQHPSQEPLADPPAAVLYEMQAFRDRIRPGARICLAVGSRGISRLPELVKAIIDALRSFGADPFIIPAMGSHGGATAAGQAELLQGLGVTEVEVGAPIHSAMDVVQVGRLDTLPVFCDRLAAAADGLLLLNRIKPHTDFRGRLESGISKMLVVGVGKHEGAIALHQHGMRGLRELIPQAALLAAGATPFWGGIAVVENSDGDPAIIRAVAVADFLASEEQLLSKARALMPRLPCDALDVLIVERMGKDISGTGMDPNVIGRLGIIGEAGFESPRIGRIVVLDLTDQSHGNALGIGLADFTTRRLVRKIDQASTYENALTSTFVDRAKVPLTAANDLEAIGMALRTVWRPRQEITLARIAGTHRLGALEVSDNLLPLLERRTDLTVVQTGRRLEFSRSGDLLPLQW